MKSVVSLCLFDLQVSKSLDRVKSVDICCLINGLVKIVVRYNLNAVCISVNGMVRSFGCLYRLT